MPFSPTKLREHRQVVGLSQTRVSSLVGCSTSEICAYERGRWRPGIDRLESLAEVLDVRIERAEILRFIRNQEELK